MAEVKLTPKQKKRQERIINDLTGLIEREKAKFGGGNKELIKQFEYKITDVIEWIPKKKKK
tara:strand:+ start:130 stop:312 length:183 start_codon:yes stop_codon:yes gene_type:complete